MSTHCDGRRHTEDDGHEHWLKNLQTKKGEAVAFLQRLRARRRDLIMAKEAVRTFQEGLRRIELAALEERRNKRIVHPYEGQERRVDWNESTAAYPSVTVVPKVPVRPPPFQYVDPWASSIDLEEQAAGWQAIPPHEGAGNAGDSGSCVSVLFLLEDFRTEYLAQGTLFWVVVGWMLLCIWLG